MTSFKIFSYLCTLKGVLAQLVERQVRNLEVRGSTPLCSTNYAVNQQVTEVIHNSVHRNKELCIISFISLYFTQNTLLTCRVLTQTATKLGAIHAIRPSGHKKILPPEKKAGNYFHSWSGDLEGRLRLAASCSRAPRHLGQHGAGLLAGDAVDVVVAEENLRGSCAGRTVLGHVVGADVNGRGGGLFHHLDGRGLCVCAGHTVRLTLGGLDNQIDAAIIGQRLIQLEGEGVTLAHDGGAGGVLDAQEGRRDNHRLAAASDNPVVQAGEQVGSGDLGAGAKDAAALLRERELVPRENVLVGEGLPHGGQTLENTLDLGLVLGPDRTAIAAIADVLAVLHLCGRYALGAAAHLLEGDGRNVLHS